MVLFLITNNRKALYKQLWSFLRLYSSRRKTHYEVLNLQKNCTDKDIKDAFIQMSKEYHPDKNKSAKAQEKFVQVVEAYNVLGKPNSRAQYDQTSNGDGYSYVHRTNAYYRNNQNNYNTNYTNTKSSKSYYGVQGVPKISNFAIIMIAFGIAVVGVILQVVVIRESYFIHRKQINNRSMMLAEELEKVRDAAKGTTRDMQTQVMLDKIMTGSNPSVATASIGQALAEEKKDSPENIQSTIRVLDEDYTYNVSMDNVKLTLYELIKKILSYP